MRHFFITQSTQNRDLRPRAPLSGPNPGIESDIIRVCHCASAPQSWCNFSNRIMRVAFKLVDQFFAVKNAITKPEYFELSLFIFLRWIIRNILLARTLFVSYYIPLLRSRWFKY